jgi:hypothetical protein
MRACWMAALTITGKPTGFYSRILNKGWPFIRELKYKVVMLPRWLVSTPICTYGVGGLTNNSNSMTAEMGQLVQPK